MKFRFIGWALFYFCCGMFGMVTASYLPDIFYFMIEHQIPFLAFAAIALLPISLVAAFFASRRP